MTHSKEVRIIMNDLPFAIYVAAGFAHVSGGERFTFTGVPFHGHDGYRPLPSLSAHA